MIADSELWTQVPKSALRPLLWISIKYLDIFPSDVSNSMNSSFLKSAFKSIGILKKISYCSFILAPPFQLLKLVAWVRKQVVYLICSDKASEAGPGTGQNQGRSFVQWCDSHSNDPNSESVIHTPPSLPPLNKIKFSRIRVWTFFFPRLRSL